MEGRFWRRPLAPQILAGLLLFLPAAAGRAEVFDLRDHGRLEFYPVGEWKFTSEDVGELKIDITPKRPGPNASATLAVVMGSADDYPTEEKLARHLNGVGQRLLDSGEFAEKKVVLKKIYHQQGFGLYFMFTDFRLVGRAPIPGDYKKICLGIVRLSPTVKVRLQIMSDGEETQPFQQLLGMVEGMELKAP